MTAETDIAAIDDAGANTAAEVRTALTSVLGRADGVRGHASDSTTRSFTPDNVWETVGGTTVTFDAPGVPFLVFCTVEVRGTSANWMRFEHRLIIDEGTGGETETGYTPSAWIEAEDTNVSTSRWHVLSFMFVVTGIADTNQHTIALRTRATSNVDRQYRRTLLVL